MRMYITCYTSCYTCYTSCYTCYTSCYTCYTEDDLLIERSSVSHTCDAI